MATENKRLVDGQISLVVHGFVQIWNEFEEGLAKELAVREGRENDSRLNATYQMVFRVGNSLITRNMSMGELSAALSVPMSTATRMVDLLVAEGCVRRLPDPTDRRVVRVAVTGRGRKIYRLMDSYIRRRVRKIATYLEEDELDTLLALLSKVAVAVKKTSG
jgi:DNA-binding MarR family transcriptional regulator